MLVQQRNWVYVYTSRASRVSLMKFIKKIPTIVVKRCFVISNLVAKKTRRDHIKSVDALKHFQKNLHLISTKVLKMSEKQLDFFIGQEWQKRLDSYNSSNWLLAEVSTSEVGVWTRAGELPLRWTNKSLLETATKVKRALGRRHGFKNGHIRAAQAIKGILQNSIDEIQTNPYLLPIVFKGDFGTRGRRRLKTKVIGDIDDGSMRSIALAVNGFTKLKVYFGRPK